MKHLCLIILFVIFIFNSVSIEYDDFSDDLIQIEIKGNVNNEGVYEVNRGASLNEIMQDIEFNEDADLSTISLVKPLKDKQVVVIPKVSDIKLISINSADIDLLMSLPGIGEKTAQRIIEYRDIYGSFSELEELMNVKGIGEKKYEKLKDFICL